jgi:DNA-binding transcriptional ArsR family regulator
MYDSAAGERQLVDRLLETLRTLPEASAELRSFETADASTSFRYDADIEFRIPGKSVNLLVEVKRAIYPRDIRELLWMLERLDRRRSRDHEAVPMFIAESVSPGAKALMQEQLIGYYDTGGSLFLPARGAYFYIDRPPPKSLDKSIKTLFSGRRAQVLQVLLLRHSEWFGVTALAEEAQVSPATVSQVMTELEKLDWVESRGQGPSKERHLHDPTSLLDNWAATLKAKRMDTPRRYFVPGTSAEALVDSLAMTLDDYDVQYAITHQAAAQRYAPYLTGFSQVRCRLVFNERANRALSALNARVVDEGANLAILEVKSPAELLVRERVGHAWLASPIQVYLDLVGSSDRGVELAEHLRRERIGF